MALVKLPDNGQEFPLDDAIAGNDDMLKSALRSVYPEIGDPQIKREQKDGQMVVTVVKQAGRKGSHDEEGREAGHRSLLAGFDVNASGETVVGVIAGDVEVIIPAPPQSTLFDYSALDIESRIVVQQRAQEIKGLMRRAGEDIVEIGRKMLEVKARLPHGRFTPWLEAEFGCSQDTANNFMRVAQRFGNNPKLSEFAPSALYLLAAPSTPDSARQEALDRVEAGESIGPSAAKEIITEHKEAQARADETISRQVIERGDKSYTFQPDEVAIAGRFKPTLFDVSAEAVAPEVAQAPAATTETIELGEPGLAEHIADMNEGGLQTCRVCGCTEEAGCEGGCTWVEDDLCSSCVPQQATAPTAEAATPLATLEPEVPAAPKEAPTPAPKPAAAQAPAPTPAPVPTPALPLKAVAPPTYEQSTISVALQLFPDDGDPKGRMVLVAARIEGGAPVTCARRWDDLLPMPAAVIELLEGLREQVEAARAVAEAAQSK